MKGDQMGILAAYPTPRELPLSNRTRFKCDAALIGAASVLLGVQRETKARAGRGRRDRLLSPCVATRHRGSVRGRASFSSRGAWSWPQPPWRLPLSQAEAI